MEEYYKRIVDEFNKWAELNEEAQNTPGALLDESMTAFMCNAISHAVIVRSTDQGLKEYFSQHAKIC